jgi:hypothetical protein
METLAWSTVSDYVANSLPFRQPLGGNRGAQLVFGGTPDRMEVHLPCAEFDHPPKITLAHLQVHRSMCEGERVMVLRGEGLSNLQPMHQLGVLCATFFEAAGTNASDAFRAGLSAWSQLLAGKPLLPAESQLGLRGELTLLRALIASWGPAAVLSWTAYDELAAGRHDFRMNGSEIEVKSTRGSSRHHWISSMQQLVSSPELTLFLLSLQFEQAGLATGQTLPECVQAVRSLLDEALGERARFEHCLALSLYRDEDAIHYDERLHLASDPRLIPVDGNLPALTAGILSEVFPPHTLQRLCDLKYQVDCDGLGFGPEHACFTQIVGSWNN